jgi:hypothetical protein
MKTCRNLVSGERFPAIVSKTAVVEHRGGFDDRASVRRFTLARRLRAGCDTG